MSIFESIRMLLVNEITLNDGNIYLSNLNSENIVVINTIFFSQNRICIRNMKECRNFEDEFHFSRKNFC